MLYFFASVGMLLAFCLSIADQAIGQNLRGVMVNGSVALALVKGGLSKKGQRIHAPLEGGKTVPCTIAESPVFFDPEGERLRD